MLNSDRITAVTHNVQTMTAVNVTTPFSSEMWDFWFCDYSFCFAAFPDLLSLYFRMIVLYCFITLLALALLAQLTSTIINVFQFPPVETYAAPINLPTYGIGSSSMGGEGLQRSALWLLFAYNFIYMDYTSLIQISEIYLKITCDTTIMKINFTNWQVFQNRKSK